MTQTTNSVSLISIFTYKLVLIVENIINALIHNHDTSNSDLQAWAKIEFKHDASYAYYHVKEFGVAPTVGVKA